MIRFLPLERMANMLRKERPSRFEQWLGGWMLRNLPGMLTCVQFEEFLYDYYEDQLSPEVRSRFETHMKLCPKCEVHFSGYVRTVALGRRVCEEDDRLPADLPEELVGAILLARHGHEQS